MSIFTQQHSGLFIQFQPGKQPYFLGDCEGLDTIPNPRTGGIDYVQCWNRHRDGFVTLAKKKSAPGGIEFTITELFAKAASYLEQVKCPFTVYAVHTECGEPGVFNNWERAEIVADTEIMDDPMTQVAAKDGSEEVIHEFSLSGVPPRIDARNLSASRQTTAETLALYALAQCGNLWCGDKCQKQTLPCDNIIAGGESAAGTANLLHTGNNGVLWAAAATDPFAATEDIMSIACFEIGAGTNRWLVARAGVAATPMHVKYSDDGGITWADVIVGATNLEGATGPKSLMVLDWQHIWLVTDSGNVYFSDDGGETWTDQNALAASGGNDLNAIDFADQSIGYAVGDSDTIIKTIDGGTHWYAATATGTGDNLLAVTTFSQYRVLVGTDNLTAGGSLWMTFDGTTSWEEKDFVGHATEAVTDMDFVNEYVGLIITGLSTSASDTSSMHHTIDGGHDWKELVIPDNDGLNAVIMCDVNEGFAVGNAESGTAVILHISG